MSSQPSQLPQNNNNNSSPSSSNPTPSRASSLLSGRQNTFPKEPDLYSALLHSRTIPHDGPCDHGTFSPRIGPITSRPSPNIGNLGAGSRLLSFGAIPLLNGDTNDGDSASIRSIDTARVQAHRQSTAQLMKQGGVKRPWLKYASYYIPSLNWMAEYESSSLAGDVVAGGK